MTATVNSQPKRGTFPTGDNRKKGTPDGNRIDRRMATEAKAFVHEALMELRESLSLSGEDARDQAQALASAVKAWQTTRVEWRYAYGKPVPGSRRPVPETPKKSKPKLRPGPKAPERPPAPATEVKPADPTPQEPTA